MNMGSKKKIAKKKTEKKQKPNTSLMDEVAKSNPEFVKWLSSKKRNRAD